MTVSRVPPSPTSPATLSLLGRIGHTPLVELRRFTERHLPAGVRMFAKLEGHNPSGSTKDRVAARLVSDLEARGVIEPGQTLVEASTGNTAIALALVARQKGYGLEVVVPHGVAPAIADLLGTLAVPIHWCEPKAGMGGCIEHADRLVTERGYVAAQQFKSPMNIVAHYEGTGCEIVEQVDASGVGRVDLFVSGIGTGGTAMGCGRRLRERWPDVRVVGVEPAMGEKLQGLKSIEEGYHPPLVELEALDGRWIATAAQSIDAAREVAVCDGVFVGISAGACLHVARRMTQRMEAKGELDPASPKTVVVMASDGAWKYLPARPWEAAARGDGDLDEVHWW